MPVEFKLQDKENSSDSTRLTMMYDGSGRRISKTFLTKSATATSWDTVKVTHYTGIGTEVREEFHNGSREKVNVVVNMPEGLGRYGIEDAADPLKGISLDENGKPTSWSALNPKFEWYLKNHLGSTMLVYGTVASTDPNTADIGETKAAYDYRAFGEMVTLSQPSDKVTENFTGKEKDDETQLDYFGARYLDPMLGLWISVDPARQFASPYLYAGNGYNPVNGVDSDGNEVVMDDWTKANYVLWLNSNVGGPEVKAIRQNIFAALESSDQVYHVRVKQPVDGLDKGTKGMYDSEYQAAMYDGTMENFFHELLAHAGLDEAIYERSGITLGNSNWFEPENNGREHFLDDEIRARGMGNSQTPANLMNIIEEYGNFYDLHYIDEVDVKE